MISEFCPEGGLDKLYSNEEVPFPWALRLKVVQDVAAALNFLHCALGMCFCFVAIPYYCELGMDPKVVHLDIKAPNVLMCSLDPTAKVVCKLADFGTAKLMLTPVLAGRYVENPLYLAPEVLLIPFCVG